MHDRCTELTSYPLVLRVLARTRYTNPQYAFNTLGNALVMRHINMAGNKVKYEAVCATYASSSHFICLYYESKDKEHLGWHIHNDCVN
jgi:hypothetical protein